jgi:O-antigen/teichoic acid export membrane protein
MALLGQTLLPALSKVQDDSERLNRILVKLTSMLILLGLPALVVIGLSGPSLLSIAYGRRYAAAAGALAVATAVVFVNVLNAQITTGFYAKGRPALHRRAVAVSAGTMLIVIYPACKLLGLVGGQVAALLAVAISYFLQLMRMRGLTGLDLLRYGRAFIPAALVSGGILGVGLGARFLGPPTEPLAQVALGAVLCVIAYVLCLPAFRRIRQIT